jgi:hypothetical protein
MVVGTKMAVFWVVVPCSLVTWHYNPEESYLSELMFVFKRNR